MEGTLYITETNSARLQPLEVTPSTLDGISLEKSHVLCNAPNENDEKVLLMPKTTMILQFREPSKVSAFSMFATGELRVRLSLGLFADKQMLVHDNICPPPYIDIQFPSPLIARFAKVELEVPDSNPPAADTSSLPKQYGVSVAIQPPGTSGPLFKPNEPRAIEFEPRQPQLNVQFSYLRGPLFPPRIPSAPAPFACQLPREEASLVPAVTPILASVMQFRGQTMNAGAVAEDLLYARVFQCT